MSVRVVVADDNYLVRQGVTGLIDAESDLSVAGVAGTYDELLDFRLRSSQITGGTKCRPMFF